MQHLFNVLIGACYIEIRLFPLSTFKTQKGEIQPGGQIDQLNCKGQFDPLFFIIMAFHFSPFIY